MDNYGPLIKTADELDEDLANTVTSNAYNNLYYRLENIRRGTLVSGVATAVRNGLAQFPRAGIDTLGYLLETAFNPNKRQGMKATLSQLKYTFANTGDAVSISNAILKNFDVQTRRMWNQYSEVGHGLRKRNPNQHAVSNVDVKKKTKAPKGLDIQKERFSVLDKWENLIQLPLSEHKKISFPPGKIDCWSKWIEAHSLSVEYPEKYADDLHLNKSGHLKFANIFYDQIVKYREKNNDKKFR